MFKRLSQKGLACKHIFIVKDRSFLKLVERRAEDSVEGWAKSLNCPMIRVDGTKPIEENTNLIAERLKELQYMREKDEI